MILPRPELRLPAGIADETANCFAGAERGNIFVKRDRASKWQRDQRRDRKHEEFCWLNDRLEKRDARNLSPRKIRDLPGNSGAKFRGEDGVAEFHPGEKNCDSKRCFGDVFFGEGAAAHVRPEIEERRKKRERAERVPGGGARRARPEQMNAFLDQIERSPFSHAFLFHGSSAAFSQMVPS